MDRRSIALLSGAAIIAGAVVFGKPPSTTAAPTPLRTVWGDPDLQGIWSQKYQIPL